MAVQVRNPELVSLLKADFSPQVCELRMVARNIWRIGSKVLDLDLSGTAFDTDAELVAMGVRRSDTTTPFPTTLAFPVSGTWSHTADVGWLPAFTADEEGPALLIPICRPGNWELEVEITFNPAADAHMMALFFGYVTNSNHVGAYTQVSDTNAAADELIAYILTNDGDDNFTIQYTGAALVETGDKIYRFRSQNACVRAWDEQDDAWHDYEGRQNVGAANIGRAYTAGWAFLQFYKYAAVPFAQTHIKNLKLTYLL